jgi:hypothetical protein
MVLNPEWKLQMVEECWQVAEPKEGINLLYLTKEGTKDNLISLQIFIMIMFSKYGKTEISGLP